MSLTLKEYYQSQSHRPGWQDLAESMLLAISASTDKASARDFQRMIGTHLARRFPLPNVTTQGELEDGINRLFRQFGWGVISITSHALGMNIHHQAWPCTAPGDDEEQWMTAFANVLEGCWTHWMQALGGDRNASFWMTHGDRESLSFSYQVDK